MSNKDQAREASNGLAKLQIDKKVNQSVKGHSLQENASTSSQGKRTEGKTSPSGISGTSKKERCAGRGSEEYQMGFHEKELIGYVQGKWNSVEKELKSNKTNEENKVTVYQETEQNPSLKNFEPFDLEAWWGKRVYENLTQNSSVGS